MPGTGGKTVLVGTRAGMAWLWDAPSGRTIGPPVVHGSPIEDVGFRPDGRTFVTVGNDDSARAWPMPGPIAGGVNELRRQLEAETGQAIDESQVVATLDPAEWADRRQEPGAPEAEDDVAWHDARARDAEGQGDLFRTLWHLDRMIADGPGPAAAWTPLVRRGRALSRAGQLERAGADYDRAAALAPPGAMLDWYLHRLTECEAAGHWETLRWYAGRAGRSRPTTPTSTCRSPRRTMRSAAPRRETPRWRTPWPTAPMPPSWPRGSSGWPAPVAGTTPRRC